MLVNIKNLSFSYLGSNKKTLKNIDIEINGGERILLAGINGAGKSTLLRILSGQHAAYDIEYFNVAGYRTPQSGVGGVSFVGDTWKRSINFVGTTNYMVDMLVRDFMKKVQDQNIKRRNELVDILKIDLNWNIKELSDGQRRRVQIMLGLVQPFKLLLLDEITSELDIIVRRNFLNYLKKETIENNSTVIYATHILDELSSWTTKIFYIDNNRNLKKYMWENTMSKISLKNIIVDNMLNDYNIMEKEKSTEEAANKKTENILFGPQGGYSSGRSQNILKQ
tara:strand:- start:1938 stop:2777 length:840 start_codon:yes stop_codon:yes gene_type:complete